jgi:energy-coupling factor transporter ATP-binding protein EcfA2
MRIEKVLLRDVGPFEDVTIELPTGTNPAMADVYLLTGPNGTGKSTLLYALALILGGGHGIVGAGVTEIGREAADDRYYDEGVVEIWGDAGRRERK